MEDNMLNTINKFYDKKIQGGIWDSSIEVKLKEYNDTFNIELMNIWDKKADCKIGHFGYNVYFRTRYGIQAKRYKNLKTMAQAIRQSIKKHGYNVEYFVLKRYTKEKYTQNRILKNL